MRRPNALKVCPKFSGQLERRRMMNQTEITSQQLPEVSQVVEHLFRHEGGKMVATLTRIFGIEHLALAEDVVQEALARALQTWPFYGVPNNPAAWIMRTSRNLALDVVRRRKVFQDKEDEIAHLDTHKKQARE